MALASIAPPLTEELRQALDNLAAGLFDLPAWLTSPAKYVPPVPKDQMPWRAAGHQFTPKDVGVIRFFEGLLIEASGDNDLFARWSSTTDPLQFCPLENPLSWRANRGLSNPARFGINANVLLTDPVSGKPISRRTFYDSCWPLLLAVIADQQRGGMVDWKQLANDLAGDQAAGWPKTSNPTSSAFITQFLCDLLYGMMGMRNPISAPMRYAILVELGEHRRTGNHYELSDAESAVKEVRDLLKRLRAASAPPPAAMPVRLPPVGSPPHDRQ